MQSPHADMLYTQCTYRLIMSREQDNWKQKKRESADESYRTLCMVIAHRCEAVHLPPNDEWAAIW